MEESKSLDALANILGELVNRPYDISLHAQHIRLANTLQGMESEAVSAREMFTNYFAAGDDVWMDLITSKERIVNLNSVNGAEELLALYQRAELDYLSIPVLKRHLELLVERHAHYASGEPKPDELGELFSTEWTRHAMQDVVNKGIGHLTQSYVLWDQFRDWELELLENSPASEKSALVQDLEGVLLERLRQPHSNIEDTFQTYSSFTTNHKPPDQYESLLIAASKIKSQVVKAVERREPMETALVQSNNSLEAFARYIAYERRAKYPDLLATSTVYERAITEAAKRRFVGEAGAEEALRSFWAGYSDVLRTYSAGQQVELNMFKRAVRSVPGSGEVWARYIRCVERYSDPDRTDEDREVVSELYARAMSSPLVQGDVEQIVPIVLARAGFEKRIIDIGNADEDTLPTMIGILESGIEAVRKAAPVGDARMRLEKYLAEIYRIAEVTESAVNVWESAAKHYKTSYLAWTSYTDTLIKADMHDEARKVFSDICPKNMDWPEAIWESWIAFEHLHGSIEQIDACLDKVEKAQYQVNMRRAKEAEKAAYQAMQIATEQQASTVSVADVPVPQDSMDVDENTARGAKRAAEDELTAEEFKRSKLEHNPALLKRDRENCTIFVAGIPNETSKEEIVALLKDCGEVREVKMTRLEAPATSTVATVEFADRDSIPAALTKDKKRLRGEEIAVHLAWKSTLYVTNFPETADDAYIRNLFGKYGTIFDVRWPSKKFKTTRRFCYVQYTSPTAAQNALELHGRELEADRAINVLISNPERKKERTDQDKELHVSGLPKSTTKKDLEKVFSQFGVIKEIRMVTDDDKKFKGFAFVEFESESSARAGLDANNQELKGRRMAVTLSDSRGKPRNRNFAADTGLGRKAELRNRSIRIRNLPVGTQEGLLQQTLEKYAAVIRVEVFTDVNEAVAELSTPADVGKLLLKTEPIIFSGNPLNLSGESSSASSGRRQEQNPAPFIPRNAASRPKAGLGHKRKLATPINSTPSGQRTVQPTSTGDKSASKGQDDFRKLLSGS